MTSKKIIRCKDCEYCKVSGGSYSANRNDCYCEHPDYEYISKYFDEHRMVKMPAFLGFTKPFSKEVPVKTSPKWCPLKKEAQDE